MLKPGGIINRGIYFTCSDKTIPDSATLREVFREEVDFIKLNAKTKALGKRRVYRDMKASSHFYLSKSCVSQKCYDFHTIGWQDYSTVSNR